MTCRTSGSPRPFTGGFEGVLPDLNLKKARRCAFCSIVLCIRSLVKRDVSCVVQASRMKGKGEVGVFALCRFNVTCNQWKSIFSNRQVQMLCLYVPMTGSISYL